MEMVQLWEISFEGVRHDYEFATEKPAVRVKWLRRWSIVMVEVVPSLCLSKVVSS